MLTDLQQQKITRLFNVYDVDGNGIITENEPKQTLMRLADVRDVHPGTPEFEAFQAGFLVYWHATLEAVDSDKDGQISLEEWLVYHDQLLQDQALFEQTILVSGKFMFDLMDANGDGVISLDEYRLWMKTFGVQDDQIVGEVFTRLDLNGDGQISGPEMMQLITEYYYSNDREAPGSWAMGPI